MLESISHYQISLFISRLIEDQRLLSRVEFVQALGYRNIARGLNWLDPWLDRGGGFFLIIKNTS
jgi:hypothetical protein